MSRDYKNRAASQKNKKPQQQGSIAWWKWLVIVLLITVFAMFLSFLKNSTPETVKEEKTQTKTTLPKSTTKTPKHQDQPIIKPKYDFYTILPETEIIVPDNEIKIRGREEFLGKRNKGNYNVQAGSFRHFNEADKLKAKLAFMGIESRIEKATVGGVTWNRIKMGPFSSSSQVSILKKRLKKNGVDIIVTEAKP